MKPSELKPLLVTAFKNGRKVLIKGAPGIGKTDIVAQAAKAAGMDLIVSHPAISDPTDFKGMPAVVGSNGSTRADFIPFGDLRLLIDADKPTVAFADDLGQSPHAVQAAYMQPLQARHINSHKISDHVVFCAATNDTTHRAGVNALLEPVKSRFDTIITLEADIDDFVAWAFENGMPAELIAFLRFRPSQLSDFQPTRELTNSPSPRTAAAIGRWINIGVRDKDVFVGCAGEGFAVEFISFLQIYESLPDLDAILANPDKAPVPKEASVIYAVTTGLAKKLTQANAANAVKYVERLPKEYMVCGVRDFNQSCEWFKNTGAYAQWCVRNADLLR